MTLDLSDDDTALLLRELDTRVANDRYFLSPRIQTLKAILAKIRPEPARETLPRPRCMRRREQLQLRRRQPSLLLPVAGGRKGTAEHAAAQQRRRKKA
jgi:hypothetical protein